MPLVRSAPASSSGGPHHDGHMPVHVGKKAAGANFDSSVWREFPS